MKTLCELKRKDIAKYFEATMESLREPDAEPGYLCRDCLRLSCDKKRLCEPVSLRKLKFEQELQDPPPAC